MKELTKSAQLLAEKRTHLRAGVEKIMAEFAAATEGAENISAAVLDTEHGSLYIRAGKEDLYWQPYPEHFSDYNKDRCFYNCMSIPELRQFVQNLPVALEKIQEKMDEEIFWIDEFLAKQR